MGGRGDAGWSVSRKRDQRKAQAIAFEARDDHGEWFTSKPPRSPHGGDGDFTREVIEATRGWQVEELHTEEGRLDEVFRSITMPDTKGVSQGRSLNSKFPNLTMNSWANIKTIAKRELGRISRRRWRMCSSSSFCCCADFSRSSFFERGEASLGLVLRMASVVLSVPCPGGRHEALGGRAACGHAGTADDDAGHRRGRRSWENSSRRGCSSALLWC